jgi:hypothetical protein
MRKLSFIAALSFCLLVSTFASAAMEAEAVRVYSGGDGVEVVVLALKEKNKFLVQVTGSGSTMDGLVLPFQLDSSGRFYSSSWRGTPYTFLEKEKSLGTLPASLGLYTTKDVRYSQRVHFDEKRTQAVKAADIISRHLAQMKDGSVERFGRFDRKGEEKKNDAPFNEAAQRANKACGTQIPASIVWSDISDDHIKDLSIEGFCSAPLSAMEGLCKWSEARTVLKAKVKKVTCRFGEALKMDLDASGTLVWTAARNGSNIEEFARKYLETLQDPVGAGKSSTASGGEAPPWGQGRTLGEKVLMERSSVCTDGKSAYYVRYPDERNINRMYYGNGKKFNRIAQGSNGRFFEPRYLDPSVDPKGRYPEMRFYSTVEVHESKGTCTVICGTRRSELKLLDTKAAAEILSTASYAPPLHTRKPHVLTRDDQGNYYYVDRGNTPETEKNFRLFTGPRGSLKQRTMTNVVSDSQGEIFSTKSGQLRFIAGPAGRDSSWVQGKKVTKLTPIPVEDNYQVIYSDLGVYSGERLGTPCDDL